MNNRRQFLKQTFGAIAGLAVLPVDADLSLDRLDPNSKGQIGISGHVFPPMTATEILESRKRFENQVMASKKEFEGIWEETIKMFVPEPESAYYACIYDSKGKILADYIPMKKSENGQYHCDVSLDINNMHNLIKIVPYRYKDDLEVMKK